MGTKSNACEIEPHDKSKINNGKKCDETQSNLATEEEMIFLKVYRIGKEVLVAGCDCDLKGRTFIEGDLRLEVVASFFGEEKVCEEDLGIALKRATIANIIGWRSVACAIRFCCIDEKNVLTIDGVPYAQMVRM